MGHMEACPRRIPLFFLNLHCYFCFVLSPLSSTHIYFYLCIVLLIIIISDSSYTTSSHLGVNMIHFHIHTTEYSGLASTLTEMSLSFAINIF